MTDPTPAVYALRLFLVLLYIGTVLAGCVVVATEEDEDDE